mgnify:CR=1 FL=1
MYAVLKSFGLKGLNGFPVEVEADISGGMPALSIVGLPDSAVRESGDRVRSAVKNLGYKWPDRHITVNLAPADIRKSGPVYDLPLLLAVLASIAAVIINYLVTHWDEIKQNFSQTLADLAQALNTAGENLQHIWDTLWLTIKLLGLQIWESITTGWNNFWKGIDLALRMAGAALQAAWSACWLIIKLTAMQIWEDVTTAWSNFWKGLSLLLSMAGAALNAVWTAAWSALADTVSSIWDGITSVVRGAVSDIIRIINGMISAIVGGMNAVIGLLNGFCFDVPEFAQDALGTAKVGFNIDPITAPQIPYLAQGAVIPANHEFLAVLGDQTNGTNVEAPLETIQQALAEVLAEWGGQDITIRFAASGGLEQLVRLLMPYIDKEKVRRGARLVVGGN